MKINLLTTESLGKLRVQYSDNKRHYINNNKERFTEYFKLPGELLELEVATEGIELDYSDKPSASDAKNARILYSSLMDIPVSAASDERLWSALAHGQLWDFVQYRRGDELASGNDKDIINSYFFTYGPRRSMFVNCISRLWWTGHLTFDQSRENPFELTDLITEGPFASTLLLISSSNLINNKDVFLGILESINKLKHEGGKIERKTFVGPLKYLNRMSAVTVLDVLERGEITEMIDGYLTSPAYEALRV